MEYNIKSLVIGLDLGEPIPFSASLMGTEK